MIHGALTYEEAYAFSVGWGAHELHTLPAVVEARRLYDEGEYDHPDRYYIHPDIPAKTFRPVPPEDVLPWDTDLMMLAIQESLNVSPTTPLASTQHEDPPAPATGPTVPVEASGPSQPPTYSTTLASRSVAAPNQNPGVATLASSLAQVKVADLTSSSPYTNSESSGTSSSIDSVPVLDVRMKHILNYFFGFGAEEFDRIDAILSVPRLYHRLYPTLMRAGMEDGEAGLFCDCLLGTLPETDW